MENVLRETGNCGRFQLFHVSLVQMCRFVSVWARCLMVYGLYDPGWLCVVHQNHTESSLDIHHSDPPRTNSSGLAGEPFTSAPVIYSTNESSLGDVTVVSGPYSYNETCDVFHSCDDVDFNDESTTIVTQFGLHCDRVWAAHLIVSVLSAGMLVGALFWGQFGERFGRKPSLYLSTFIMFVSCGLAALAPVWEVYALLTFFIGFGNIAIPATVYTLCMEFLSSKWRARLISIPIWNVSVVCFALAAFLLRDWKQIHIVAASMMGICCLGIFWTSESLRWLQVHGKTSQAKKVVDKISRLNRNPVSEETWEQILSNDGVEGTERQYTYLDLFRNRDIRVLTIKLTVSRCIPVSVYDMINYSIQSLPGDFYTNILLASLVEIPLNLLVGPLANRIGRRWTGILMASLGTVSCTVMVVALVSLDDNATRGLVVTSTALINKSATQALICITLLQAGELLPTAVRNLSMGFYDTVIRVILILGPFILPRDHPSMVACFAVLLVAQVVNTATYCTLPETKDAAMKDNILNRKV